MPPKDSGGRGGGRGRGGAGGWRGGRGVGGGQGRGGQQRAASTAAPRGRTPRGGRSASQPARGGVPPPAAATPPVPALRQRPQETAQPQQPAVQPTQRVAEIVVCLFYTLILTTDRTFRLDLRTAQWVRTSNSSQTITGYRISLIKKFINTRSPSLLKTVIPHPRAWLPPFGKAQRSKRHWTLTIQTSSSTVLPKPPYPSFFSPMLIQDRPCDSLEYGFDS